MTYRSYVLEFQSDNAEIGTAISNIDGSRVVVITMHRPSFLSLSTKQNLENLYNFLDAHEDNAKTSVVLKNIEGRTFDHFVSTTNSTYEVRTQIALEILKKMLRYDAFPDPVKLHLIEEDQILFNEDGIFLREIVNFSCMDHITAKEVIAAIGNLLSRLLNDAKYPEKMLLEQMKGRNHSYYTIADAYAAYRDVFIYKKPLSIEKRIYIYRENGEVIDETTVERHKQALRNRKIQAEKNREETIRDHKIDLFEKQIAKQADLVTDTEYIGDDDLTDFTDTSTASNTTYASNAHTSTAHAEEGATAKVPEKPILDANAQTTELSSQESSTRPIPRFDTAELESAKVSAKDTVNIKQVQTQITNSLKEIAQEVKEFNKTSYLDKVEIASDAAPANEETEDALIDELFSEDQKFSKNKKGKKAKKREKQRAIQEEKRKLSTSTELLDKFAEEAIAETEKKQAITVVIPETEAPRQLDKDTKQLENSKTMVLPNPDDIPVSSSPKLEYKAIDGEEDLDVFYYKLDQDKVRKKKFSRIVTFVGLGVVAIGIVLLSLLFTLRLLEPIQPSFKVESSGIDTIQCTNTSKGQNKIESYKWQVLFDNQVISEKEGVKVMFAFENEGAYIIRLEAIGKDGKIYGPYETEYQFKKEKNNDK